MPVTALEFRWGFVYLLAGSGVALWLGTMPPNPLPLAMLFPIAGAVAVSRTYGTAYAFLRDRSPNKPAARRCAAVMNAMTFTPLIAAIVLDSDAVVAAIGVFGVACGAAYFEHLRRNLETVAGRRFVDTHQ